jgi:hypothetical protein
MAQYQVPQFIEIEDKIFGPLTLKQFIYLAGGAGVCLIFFTLFPLWLMLILAVPVMSFSAALAFYKINGRPFIVAVEHAVMYTLGSKLYLWRQHEAKPQTSGAQEAPVVAAPVPKLSQSRLKDLSWSLNIKDRTQMGVTAAQRSGFEL